MNAFKPVHLPEDRQPNGRVSQTFLRHYARCPRAGYLYQLTRGQVRTVEMMRGSAGHAIYEQVTRAAMAQQPAVPPPERPDFRPSAEDMREAAGVVLVPPEIVKDIVDEVLADPQFAVPFEEHDYLREQAYRWAAETAIDPETVVAVETLFTMEVGGWQVRAKIDLAELLEEGARAHVVDYKTGRGAPSFEDVSRKLSDGRLMAKSFQLVLYALELVYGVPVRVEHRQCLNCDSTPEQPDMCTSCAGTGFTREEIAEPFPVAGRAQQFDLEFVFPGIEDREGKMVRRPVTLSRAELEQYRASLEGLVARVQHSVQTGDWPAVVSDAACDECPAKAMCPIRPELRDHRGTVNTVEQAADAFTVRHREKDEARAKSRELREFVKHNGPVRYGDGMIAELAYSEHQEISDKDGLFEAVERAALYGEPLERWRFVKVKGSNRLVERALTAEELAESEGSDGRSEEGSAGGDVEQYRDERWGESIPD